ncbi:lysylphosphatidylglycerol synthase transmembrane domain-containing protein [Natranaerofaba carboxydovora]|uniref:lysylphosphatidylglycerol synthase transmembrane domain-containing protein n=1 Tax=Natranaerofaba carboxydovora TaxID=2742683 RepID=UPI001F144653|nr:lysylphosphatidylglycerol synthase transmembrane domain-containing protein [Natranaerofaba carboxydovora]UMZ75476.1 Lysylphosphatidylglycerol synthase TM region [Natranaerofaba carboxydovora]
MNNKLVKILKSIFLLSVVAIIFAHMPEFIANVKQMSSATIIWLIVLQFVTLALIAMQWKYCSIILSDKLGGQGGQVKDFWIVNSYGTLLEGVTPAVKTGGEGLKVVMLIKSYGYDKKEAITLVIAQKIISICSFLIVMMACYIIVYKRIPSFLMDNLLYVIITATIIFSIIYFVYAFISKEKLNYLFYKLGVNKFNRLINEFSTYKKMFLNNKLSLGKAFLLGIIIWSLLGLKTFFIVVDMNINLSYVQASSATFMGYLFSMLPISPGGIGTYEGAMSFQLYNMGLTENLALTVSILSRLFTLWLTMLISFFTVTILNFVRTGQSLLYQKSKGA